MTPIFQAISTVTELILAFMCLYILYRANPQERLKYAIYFLIGLTCVAHAIATVFQIKVLTQHTPIVEHWLVRVGIILGYLGSLRKEKRNA